MLAAIYHLNLQRSRAEGRRPQDPHRDGTGLRFETMEHGGAYADTVPQANKLIDAEGRSCQQR